MPIVHFRVDQRMIHGQVALSWSKVTGTNHIILANDLVAKNEIQQSIMKMAVPSNLRVSIVELERAINYFARGIAENEKVFLLTQNVMDAKRIFESGFLEDYKSLNVGNMTQKAGAKKLTEKIFALPEEIESVTEMLEDEIDVYFQVMPGDSKISFKTILKEN